MDAEQAWERIKRGETGDKFAAFYDLLSFYNKKFNLTRITDREECEKKHFFDSLTGERYFPAGARCAEVGSGGGFPSVPLLIVRGDLSFDLFESSQKKCAFLCEVVDKLGLHARVHALRAEEAGRDPAFARGSTYARRAPSRGLPPSPNIAPPCAVGGAFAAYKGKAEEELAEAEAAFRTLGLELRTAERFFLEGESDERTLIVAEKVRNTPAAYPAGGERSEARRSA